MHEEFCHKISLQQRRFTPYWRRASDSIDVITCYNEIILPTIFWNILGYIQRSWQLVSDYFAS